MPKHWLIPLSILLSVAFAQETLSERRVALEREAQQLSILANLPAEVRAQASEWLERQEALEEAETALEVTRLEAYVAALRDGETVAVARELADQAVAEDRLALLRERAALEEEAAALSEAYPQAQALLMRRRVRMLVHQRGQDGMFGVPALEAAGLPDGVRIGMLQRGSSLGGDRLLMPAQGGAQVRIYRHTGEGSIAPAVPGQPVIRSTPVTPARP